MQYFVLLLSHSNKIAFTFHYIGWIRIENLYSGQYLDIPG